MWTGCLVAALLNSGGVGSSGGVAAAPTPECGAVVELLDAQFRMFDAFVDGDAGRLAAGIDGLASLVAAVRSAPPAGIAAEVGVWLGNADATLTAVDGVVAPDAILATLSTMPPPVVEFTAAQQTIQAWAAQHCAWTVPGTGPADCRLLDAGAAAAAAGLEIDTSAPERVDDGGGQAFASQACTYGGGALALTTFAFDDRDATAEETVGVATSIGGGRQIDVDLGNLPATAVVIEFDASVQVIVFDADVPFAVTIAGVEPATAVAAAAAVVATFPTDHVADSDR